MNPLRFVAMVGAVMMAAHGCADEPTRCDEAAAHVARCLGQPLEPQESTCDPSAAQRVLGMDCSELAATDAEKADWWRDFVCALGFCPAPSRDEGITIVDDSALCGPSGGSACMSPDYLLYNSHGWVGSARGSGWVGASYRRGGSVDLAWRPPAAGRFRVSVNIPDASLGSTTAQYKVWHVDPEDPLAWAAYRRTIDQQRVSGWVVLGDFHMTLQHFVLLTADGSSVADAVKFERL